MGSLGQARAVGGVGSILILLSLIPSVGIILGIIGWILVLVAAKALADEYDDSIFNNVLIGAVLWIIGGIVAGIVVLASLFQFVGLGSNPTLGQPATPPPDIFTSLGSVILGLFIIWIFSIVASIFIKRGYDDVSVKTSIGTFHTTGLLFLIGAATTIILVGFLIILIAILLQIVAFFSLPEQAPHGPAQAKPPTHLPPVPPVTD